MSTSLTVRETAIIARDLFRAPDVQTGYLARSKHHTVYLIVSIIVLG